MLFKPFEFNIIFPIFPDSIGSVDSDPDISNPDLDIPDPDPLTRLNPDPIGIRIRNPGFV
jgi:hypothetical protein